MCEWDDSQKGSNMKKSVKKVSNACVRNDAAFAKRIQGLAAKLAKNQLEIGKLVHLYIEEHGNKYGDGVFKHIAGLTGLAERSIRNFCNYYRLKTEFQHSANLPKLGKCIQYELARLRVHPDAKKLIPDLAKKADEERMQTVAVEELVSGYLKDAGRIKPSTSGKVKHRIAPPVLGGDPADKQLDMFNEDDEASLKQADEALQLAAKQDTKLTVPMADHRLVICNLCQHLMAHLLRLVDMGEGFILKPTVSRMAKEMEELNQKLAASTDSTHKVKEAA